MRGSPLAPCKEEGGEDVGQGEGGGGSGSITRVYNKSGVIQHGMFGLIAWMPPGPKDE